MRLFQELVHDSVRTHQRPKGAPLGSLERVCDSQVPPSVLVPGLKILEEPCKHTTHALYGTIVTLLFTSHWLLFFLLQLLCTSG